MQRKLVGYLLVDSGQIFLTDPAYLASWHHGDYINGEPSTNSYARVTNYMFNHDGYGEVENGVVVGISGDGRYPVYVTENEEGHITRIEIEVLS